MDSAPWWFVPLLTLSGVLLAQLVVLYVARTKVREDDKRRWHDRRVTAYTDFMSAADDVLHLVIDHGGDGELIWDENSPERRDWEVRRSRRADQFAHCYDLMKRKLVAVSLLASTPVRREANELAWTAYVCSAASRREVEENQSDRMAWMDFFEDLQNKRDALYGLIRTEVGVESPGGKFHADADSRLGLVGSALGKALQRKKHEEPTPPADR